MGRSYNTRLKLSGIPRWTVPMAYALGAIVLGMVLPRLEAAKFSHLHASLSMDAATAIFSSVGSGMLALTGVVFSLAFVMVQFSATAYSPRLVSWVTNSPVLVHSLGIFMATFVYSLSALSWVNRNGSGKVPMLSTFFVFVLLLASLFAFVRLIRGIGLMQIGVVLQYLGTVGRRVVRESYPSILAPGEDPPSSTPGIALEGFAKTRSIKYQGPPRSIQSLDLARLTELAVAADALVIFEVAMGDTVVEDIEIARVGSSQRSIPDHEFMRCVALGAERSFEQDPKYPMRVLVDIAIKALSAAVNDPTTAVQAIDQLEGLLRLLGKRDLDIGSVIDATGKLRVVVPVPTWDDFLILACEEIRYYGGHSIQVMRRLRALLVDLVDDVPPHRQKIVADYEQRLKHAIEVNFPDAIDRREALQEDRQGLGQPREHHVPLSS